MTKPTGQPVTLTGPGTEVEALDLVRLIFQNAGDADDH